MSKARTVKEKAPEIHERHLVMRNGFIFTATPCYGMHSPLWVVKTMSDKNCGEVEPVVMLETDQHMPLNDAISIYHKDPAADVERMVELIVKLEDEWDADWPMPYCLVELLESSEFDKLRARREAERRPDPLSQALNEGDGTYRP
jgi:hypothetical protein